MPRRSDAAADAYIFVVTRADWERALAYIPEVGLGQLGFWPAGQLAGVPAGRERSEQLSQLASGFLSAFFFTFAQTSPKAAVMLPRAVSTTGKSCVSSSMRVT